MTEIETKLLNSEIIDLIVLYWMEYQGTEYRFTSFPESVAKWDDSETFEPCHIVRGPITHDLTLEPKPLSLTMEPLDFLKEINTFGLEAGDLSLFVYFAERNEEGKFQIYEEVYRGQLENITFDRDSGLFELDFTQGLLKSLEKDCLKKTVQKGCNHALFDSGCSLDQTTFEVEAVITEITGNTIKAIEFSGFDDQYFYLGESKLVKGGRTRKAMILDHVGDTIKTQIPIPGLAVGDTLKVYPGCDKQAVTCLRKFNNVNRFAGAPYMSESEDEV